MSNAEVGFVDVSGSAAFEYIRRSLREGLSLGRAVENRWPDDSGVVWALAPPNHTRNRLLDFESGGILEQPARVGRRMTATPNASSSMASVISRYLDSSEKAMVVIEDTEGYFETPSGEMLGLVTCRFGVESYGLLSIGEDESTIAGALRLAYSLPAFNVFLTRGDASSSSLAHSAWLEGAALGIAGVAVGAYDAESYLVWLPEPYSQTVALLSP